MQPASQQRQPQAQPSKPAAECHVVPYAGLGDAAPQNVRSQAAGGDENRPASAAAPKTSPLLTTPLSAAPKRKPAEVAVNPFARKPKV